MIKPIENRVQSLDCKQKKTPIQGKNHLKCVFQFISIDFDRDMLKLNDLNYRKLLLLNPLPFVFQQNECI